jgi:membrane fusion protein (multidrug efflux system)
VTLAPQPVEITTELPGRTTAYRVADVRPQVSGLIQKRLFTEGSEVKEGQQLYQIDPASYQATYDSDQAALAKADASLTLNQATEQRQKKLFETHVTAPQDYDTAISNLRVAAAEVGEEKAAVESALINLNYTKVFAPISGRIGRSAYTEGALVANGQSSALATVQQLDPIYVDLTRSSSQLLRLEHEINAGQLKSARDEKATVRLILEDGTQYPLPGKLEFSEVSVDQGTGSVVIRAVFPNPHELLLPGMFVRAVVEEGTVDQAILAPQRGVSRNQRGEPTALVVGEDNKVELRTLKTDRVLGDNWLVTEGLKAGDKLIVEGLQKIAPGAQVRPITLATETAFPVATNSTAANQ